jgi:hypothetical protein
MLHAQSYLYFIARSALLPRKSKYFEGVAFLRGQFFRKISLVVPFL